MPEFHTVLQKAHDYENYAKNKTFLENAMGKKHFGLLEFHDKTKKTAVCLPVSHVRSPKLISDFALGKLLVKIRF